MFEQVVVGALDGQPGRDTVALARELASPQGELTLVRVHLVMSKSAPYSPSMADSAKCKHALKRLTALAAELSVDAQVSCVEARSVRHGLHEFASARHADLLVVGASSGDQLTRDLVADDTRKVLEGAPCATAVAPEGYARRASAIKKIAVGFDGSSGSERAVELARQLAAERNAELSVFQAVPATYYARDPWNVRGEIEEHVESARRRVAALGDLEAEVGFGDPVHELARHAQTVDLLVIGSREYRPIDRLLERTTAQRLADKTTSPLLVLASPAHAGV